MIHNISILSMQKERFPMLLLVYACRPLVLVHLKRMMMTYMQ